MKQILKTALALVIALAVTSILISLKDPLGLKDSSEGTSLSQSCVYIFFNLSLYGWWLYLPFVWAHAAISKHFKTNSWMASATLGGALAATIAAVLLSRPAPLIIFTDSKVFDIISFGIGGVVFGLLRKYWKSRLQMLG